MRVNERFRVIALGLPVPRYQGNPLDPPLRSRFQAREITSLPFNVSILQLQFIFTMSLINLFFYLASVLHWLIINFR